jgi:hypothetical protein
MGGVCVFVRRRVLSLSFVFVIALFLSLSCAYILFFSLLVRVQARLLFLFLFSFCIVMAGSEMAFSRWTTARKAEKKNNIFSFSFPSSQIREYALT